MNELLEYKKDFDGVIYISETHYQSIGNDFKGIAQNGKRSWMPPFALYNQTCSVTEGDRYKIIPDDEFLRLAALILPTDGGEFSQTTWEQLVDAAQIFIDVAEQNQELIKEYLNGERNKKNKAAYKITSLYEEIFCRWANLYFDGTGAKPGDITKHVVFAKSLLSTNQ